MFSQCENVDNHHCVKHPTKQCALCGVSNSLCDSHILPEFVYRPSYHASTHAAVLIDLDSGRKGKRQKGFSEYLLCKVCESKLNNWETYFANVWLNPATRIRPTALSGDLAIIRGLDYAKFKLFHLSVIWRAGICTIPVFEAVRLGGQESKLRTRLLASDPGSPIQYPFFGIALRDDKTGSFQDQIVQAPTAARVEGHWVYTIIFGGVVWHYYVSSHTSSRTIPVYFGLDGHLTLGIQNWKDNAQIKAFAEDMRTKMGKPRGR